MIWGGFCCIFILFFLVVDFLYLVGGCGRCLGLCCFEYPCCSLFGIHGFAWLLGSTSWLLFISKYLLLRERERERDFIYSVVPSIQNYYRFGISSLSVLLNLNIPHIETPHPSQS